MTWKSTAVVSGTGLLATWLASYPPANTPAPVAAPQQTTAPTSEPDIAEAADQLQARVRSVLEYREPTRNPFRFQASAAPVPTSAPAHATPAVIAAPATPPVIQVRLSGIATDTADGREQRTAILNAPEGLVFVREGDAVAGYRVVTIGENSVELVTPEGATTTIR